MRNFSIENHGLKALSHFQGLQIVLEGIEGGVPQQTPAQPPPPTSQIQSGTSGWSPGAGGQSGYQRGYAYGERVFWSFLEKWMRILKEYLYLK